MTTVADRMTPKPLTARPDERLDLARVLMVEKGARHLPVVDGGRVVGVLSLGDVLAAAPALAHPTERARAMALRGLAVGERMSKPAVTIAPGRSIEDAIALLLEKQICCLPVVEGDALVGILTCSDLMREAIDKLHEEKPAPPVARVMTARPLLTVAADEPLDLAYALMRSHHVRHLPVVEDERVIGMLSQHDVAAAVGLHAPAQEKRALRVRDAKSSPAIITRPEDRAIDAARLMGRRKVGALPVVREGRLVGIVSVNDFIYWRKAAS